MDFAFQYNLHPPLLTHLYIGILRVDVSFGQVWEVLEVKDERFGLLLGLRLREHANRSVLVMGPPPLVSVGLR